MTKLLPIIGFIVLLGTAGDSDLGRIDLTAIIIRSLIGIALVCAGRIKKERPKTEAPERPSQQKLSTTAR